LAAVLACGEGALLSHSSAAWLWGLIPAWSEVVHVTAMGPLRQRTALSAHSAARLLDTDRATFEGIPVTAVPRTLLDLAAIRPHSLARAVQRAERLDKLDLAALDALLGRNRGARGAERLRNALVPYRDPAFTRSGLERRFLQLVKEAGLSRPSSNLFIEGYELDVYWPVERFAVELDTYEFHGGRRAFEDDRVRHESLKLAGIEMIRITGARLEREPAAVMRRLQKLLAMRR
jgi:very-short-patch-repair endonuclease